MTIVGYAISICIGFIVGVSWKRVGDANKSVESPEWEERKKQMYSDEHRNLN